MGENPDCCSITFMASSFSPPGVMLWVTREGRSPRSADPAEQVTGPGDGLPLIRTDHDRARMNGRAGKGHGPDNPFGRLHQGLDFFHRGPGQEVNDDLVLSEPEACQNGFFMLRQYGQKDHV